MKKIILFITVFSFFNLQASQICDDLDVYFSELTIDDACEEDVVLTEEKRNLFSLIYRSLRFMASSVAGSIVSDYVKEKIWDWSNEATQTYRRSSGVRKHVNHIVDEWRYQKCPREARKHVRKCSICRSAASDIGLY